MERYLVSVIIPARNAAATIARAIDSVLDQDYRPLEVIVIDDDSQDGTAERAGRYGDPVRLVPSTRRRGAAGARNAGLEAARGEIIAFQDADDEWRPGKLSRQVALLQSEPSIVFVACGSRLRSPEGVDLGPLYDGQIPRAGTRAWAGLLARNTIAAPTVVAWRDALLAESGFDEHLPVAEDQDLWIRLARRGVLGYIDEPLVWVYMTPNSLSGVGSSLSCRQQIEFTLPMIERHVAALRDELSPREVRRLLGERWGRVGRAAYSYGLHQEGLRLIARASCYGFEPLRNVAFLLGSAPPARAVKRLLRPARA
jgi:glycosyltransferase involved in cell wall biosynthesis